MGATYKIEELRLNEILKNIENIKIAVIGDVCVDAYWQGDMKKSELSRETPHFPLPIVEERYSLGAAGNVVANLKALNVSKLEFISIVGNDWRYSILKELLSEINVSTKNLIVCKNIKTPTYCKPIRHGISEVAYEDPRIDFMNFIKIAEDDEEKIIETLNKVAKEVDILIVSDQLNFGCITEKIRNYICELGKKITIVTDSRDRIGLYKNVIIKPNGVEAGELLKEDIYLGDLESNLYKATRKIYEKTSKAMVITLDKHGAYYADKDGGILVPGVNVTPPIDFVGAGDTFLSAFSASLAGSAKGEEATAIGNLASSVVIKKIGITGCASREEILAKNQGEMLI